MKKTILLLYTLVFVSGVSAQIEPIDCVNPHIGTGNWGNCYPGAQAPFGMISVSPNTTYGDYESAYTRPGYKYQDLDIYGFGLTHYSGVGCHAMQDLPFMPVSGKLDRSPVNCKGAYHSVYVHERETASPGYYAVELDDYRIEMRFTADTRSILGEIVYKSGDESHIVFQPTNNANGIGDGMLSMDLRNNRVMGWASTGGFCWRDPRDRPYKVFFVAEFDTPITGYGTWKGDEKKPGKTTVSGDDIAAYISFGAGADRCVRMRCAISYVSVYNALQNLETEISDWDFAALHAETRARWNDYLGRIRVEGGTEAQRICFYTALYHNMLQANIASDVNGEYIGFDDKIHAVRPGHNYYANFSLWDTYRTTAYLQAILAPDVASDMITSLLCAGEQGGALPNWSMNNVEYGVMNGYSPFPFIANMYAFGAKDFDLQKMVKLMKRISVEHIPCKGHHGWYNVREYMDLGYVPVDKHGFGTSTTQEYGIDDYSIAQLCRAAGDIDGWQYYSQRSQNVFNLFDPETKLIRGRNSDGSFITPYSETSHEGFNEGNAIQYFWSVPHSMALLVEMAGRDLVEKRLDSFCSKINTGWAPDDPYLWIGNEPCFGAAWVYNYLQRPWKAQRVVRDLLSFYRNDPSGIPGDDDVGAMSGLYVFASMGLYPYRPGEGGFMVTAPLFNRVVLTTASGREITINAPDAATDRPYIHSMHVNGNPSTALWLDWNVLAQGATIDYELSSKPDKCWGTAKKDAPPSF